jgi:hypothetical protein
MKPPLLTVLVSIFVLAIAATVVASDKYDDVDWTAFGENLSKALESDNDGIRCSALQQIIAYHDHMNLKDAVIPVLRIYRNHPNLQTRRLALTTLPLTDHNFAISYLKRAVRFEKSPVLKKQILFMLQESESRKAAHKTVTMTRAYDLATLN